MSAHSEPTPQQIAPLLETRQSTWRWLTHMITYHVIGIFALLALMAIFLV